MKRKDLFLSDRVRGWLLNKLAGKWAVIINVDILPKDQCEAVLKASNGEYIYIRSAAFGKDIMVRANRGVSGGSAEFQSYPKDPERYRTYNVKLTSPGYK